MIPLPSPQQLRYLITLAELRHFGRAAEACAVTQSTLSAGILALERQLDAPLLDRTIGKRVVFTPLGDEVARRSRLVLDALESVQQVAQTSRGPLTGPLRLGVIPTIGPFLVSRLLGLMRERFPQITLSLDEDITGRLLDKLAMGRLDAVMLAMPYAGDGVETVPLWRDPFVLVMPQAHPLARMTRIPVERIGSERMVLLQDGHCLRDQTLDLCRQQRGWNGDEQLEAVNTATSLSTLVRMVAEGLGVALVPWIAVDAGVLGDAKVVARPVVGGPVWRTIGLGWRLRSPREADFHALASAFNRLAPPAAT